MRNIPCDDHYLAVLIEFEYSDFNQSKCKQKAQKKHFQGEVDTLLQLALKQYIGLSLLTSASALLFRKQ